jgi:glutamyl-tRNA synthetase
MHLGNASSALLAWLSVRSAGGTFVLRMEDLDANRSRADLARQVLDDLRWLGLDWDEGPDAGGPFGPYDQGSRAALYEAAVAELRERGLVYPCFCSRKDVAAAAGAPQSPGDELFYPGICRGLDPAAAAARLERGERHAWRFRVDPGTRIAFDDLVRGHFTADRPPGDFVVGRSDGVAAYQLAVVVDDVAMRITEVVRGDDLLPSTARQLLLYDAFGRLPPRFGHVPLLLDREGVRLSKRQKGITLRELRDGGWTAPGIVGRLAHAIGLRPSPRPVPAAALIGGFTLAGLARAPEGIVVDPARWSR